MGVSPVPLVWIRLRNRLREHHSVPSLFIIAEVTPEVRYRFPCWHPPVCVKVITEQNGSLPGGPEYEVWSERSYRRAARACITPAHHPSSPGDRLWFCFLWSRRFMYWDR